MKELTVYQGLPHFSSSLPSLPQLITMGEEQTIELDALGSMTHILSGGKWRERVAIGSFLLR